MNIVKATSQYSSSSWKFLQLALMHASCTLIYNVTPSPPGCIKRTLRTAKSEVGQHSSHSLSLALARVFIAQYPFVPF